MHDCEAPQTPLALEYNVVAEVLRGGLRTQTVKLLTVNIRRRFSRRGIGHVELESASGATAQCRTQYEQQRKVNYRRREQSACGYPRPLKHEFHPKVQEPET